MCKDHHCYVDSIAQISCKAPLSNEWMETLRSYDELYVRAQEPDTKGLISIGEARRMSKILKRSVCSSLVALREAGIEQPDCIITGTGMGCMENSEKFLIDMTRYGENCLKPTLFMQSTHNTISSQIAILLKCHGYNNTYSHKGISFESALFDAWLQIRCGKVKNALIGAHDEVTPLMAKVLRHTHPEYSMISETSMSAVLGCSETDCHICEVDEVKILYKPSYVEIAEMLRGRGEVLILGVNGYSGNDKPYHEVLSLLDTKSEVLWYKHIFGDNFSSSAMAFYAGVSILRSGMIPDFMRFANTSNMLEIPRYINILNHSDSTAWSVVRLKKD